MKDAEGIITTNFNIKEQLANGSSCHCHSLTFETKNEQTWLNEKIKHADPGKIISLKKPPLAVNLELFCGDKDQISNWSKETLVDKKVVVSIIQRPKDNKYSGYLMRGGIGYGYQPSYLDARNIFSMTLHKAQGKTLKAVILALSTRPTYQSQIDYCDFLLE